MNQSNMYEATISARLNDEIRKIDERLEQLRHQTSQTERNQQKVSIFSSERRALSKEKRNAEKAKKDLEERRKKLAVIQQEFSKCHHATVASAYTVSPEIIESLSIVASRLSKEQVSQLQYDLISAIRKKVFHDPRQEFTSAFKNVTELVKKLDFKVYDLDNLLNKYSEAKNNELSRGQDLYEFKQLKSINDPDRVDENRYVQIEQMLQNVDFRDKPNIGKIKKNYQAIKKQMIEKERCIKQIKNINIAINNIEKESKEKQIDYSILIGDLIKCKEEATKKLAEAEKYLQKFDITMLEAEFKKYQEENGYKERYEMLALEMEQLISKGDLAQAENIKKQMAELGKGHPETELVDMQTEAKEKVQASEYQEKIREEQKPKDIHEVGNINRKRTNQEIENRRKTIEKREEHLKEIAIKRLTEKGISLETEDRELLIQNEIDDMKRIANMTPEQRAREDGVNNHNDFAFYGDEFMGFAVSDVRRTSKEIEGAIKRQATTIYKEYIKYLAGLENKDNKMSFSEFSAMNYGYSNLDETLVDEEVIEEGRSR